MRILQETKSTENPVDTQYKSLRCDLQLMDKVDPTYKARHPIYCYYFLIHTYTVWGCLRVLSVCAVLLCAELCYVSQRSLLGTLSWLTCYTRTEKNNGTLRIQGK